MTENYLISPGISVTETDMSAVPVRPLVAGAAIVGPTPRGQVLVPTKVTSYGEYVRTFGTTFTVSGSSEEYLTSIAAKNYFEQGGESLLVVRVASGSFKPATSTVVENDIDGDVSGSFVLKTIGQGEIFNNVTSESASVGTGSLGSKDTIRFQIGNVNEDNGTFTLLVRRGDDDDKDMVILETYNNLSLDPYSSDYIAARIGDQHYSASVPEDGETYLKVEGSYQNISNYIYVDEVIKPTPNYSKTEHKDNLPKEQNGAFWGASGSNGFVDIAVSGSTAGAQISSVDSYKTAFGLLANQDEYKINIISAPGLLDTDKVAELVSLAEERGDCIAVIDLVKFGSNTTAAAEAGASQNSSYAATYWPWVQMYSATGKLVWCPASTVIPGMYAYNDKQAAPWFAPAGMTRGGISGVVQTEIKLTKNMRDKVYEKNINPIATMPGSGIVAYGQKTLQKKSSALDRINVRRLLIEVKEKVKNMASGLLFEQNTQALQNEFKGQLDPYLASVVQKKGLYAYSIDLSGNTNDAIDRNEFHCNIVLQPTRSIEFIYLNFTVTATGVEFE